MFKKLLSLFSDALTYGASSVLSQLLNFLLLPLYTRHLTPEDYGILAMLNLATAFMAPLATLGMGNAVMRFYMMSDDEVEQKKLVKCGFTSVAISTVVLTSIAFVFAVPISEVLIGKAEAAPVLQLALISAAASAFVEVPEGLLRADRRVRTIAALNILKLLVSVGVTITLVVFLKYGVSGVMIGEVVGSALILLCYFKLAFGYLPFGADRETWRRLANYGLPLIPHRLQAAALALFGQYAIRALMGLEEAGLYSVATKFSVPARFIIRAIQRAWVPFKLEIHKKDEDPAGFFRSTMTYYVAGICFLWLGIALFGPTAVRFMTASDFHAAGKLVAVVALIPIVNGFYFMVGTGFEIGKDTKPAPIISLAGLIVVVAASYAFIPTHGAEAAAVATVAGWVVMSAIVYRFARQRFPIDYDWLALVAIVGFTAITFIAVSAASISGLVFELGLATLVCILFPLVVFSILMRRPSERARMKILSDRFARRFRR